MKVYLNTKTFDEFLPTAPFEVTTDPSEAQVLVLGAKRVDYKVFTNLRVVYRFGVGQENIDFEYLRSHSISLDFPSGTAQQILTTAVADFTLYAILYCLYDGRLGDVDRWTKIERDHLASKKALIIGTGNIGRKVVDRLQLIMEVMTFDTIHNNETELEALMRKADILSVHIPLTETTRGMFDEQKLAWLHDRVLIVNTARGDIFDEEALYKKLEQSQCRAFFDVFWQEPYNGILKSLGRDKFFMTPHVASSTKEFVRAGFDDIVTIVKRFEGTQGSTATV